MASTLLKLPDEVVAMIMQHVGAAFFKDDLGRLTVSKRWYPFAQEELFASIILTDSGCLRLMRKLVANTSIQLPDWVPRVTQSLEVHVRDMTLGGNVRRWCLDGSAGRALLQRLQMPTRGEAAGGTAAHPIDLVTRIRRLRELTIDISAERQTITHPRWWSERTWFVALDRLGTLALPALRRLDLTLVGGDAFVGQLKHPCGQGFPGQPPNAVLPHTCVVINKILWRLDSLKTVHLTLEYVCPDLFRIGNMKGDLALETLSVRCRQPHASHNGRLKRCEPFNPQGAPYYQGPYRLSPFYDEMDESAALARRLGATIQDLATRSTSYAKTMRLVWSNEYSREVNEYRLEVEEPLFPETEIFMYAWDCLAGEARTFKEGEPWDSEGTVIDLARDLKLWRGKWCIASTAGQTLKRLYDRCSVRSC